MMKKLLLAQLVIALIGIQAGTALAVWGDGPGCGLGKMIWDKEPKSILPQVLGATTNAIGMQTFAISTGTSGCTNNGQVVKQEEVDVFAWANFESLSQEMAQGQGEHLASLAALIGVPPEHQAEFFVLAQRHYTTLVQTGEAAPSVMLAELKHVMAGHPVFAELAAVR